MGDPAVGDVVDGVAVNPVADDAPQVEEEADEEEGEGVDVGQVGEGHDVAGDEKEGDAHGDSGHCGLHGGVAELVDAFVGH